ncbi:hypothetical protein C2W62_12410 [Candidatus Entotheonella serta]|nr:hypothetical protein C2W62_12410 [Candidatus Entotheonella serta]
MQNPSLGPFDPGQVQIHDFNPGDLNEPGRPDHFADGGVFWTTPILPHMLRLKPSRGKTRMRVPRIQLYDFTSFANALFRNGPDRIPAQANVDVEWRDMGEEQGVHEATFSGVYQKATVNVTWAASNEAGVFFSTRGSSEQIVTHAFTAVVCNGIFHH